jgi:hypothetical protein
VRINYLKDPARVIVQTCHDSIMCSRQSNASKEWGRYA